MLDALDHLQPFVGFRSGQDLEVIQVEIVADGLDGVRRWRDDKHSTWEASGDGAETPAEVRVVVAEGGQNDGDVLGSVFGSWRWTNGLESPGGDEVDQ